MGASTREVGGKARGLRPSNLHSTGLAALVHRLSPTTRWLNPSAMVDEFGGMLTRQLDLRHEAANLRRFALHFPPDGATSIGGVNFSAPPAGLAARQMTRTLPRRASPTALAARARRGAVRACEPSGARCLCPAGIAQLVPAPLRVPPLALFPQPIEPYVTAEVLCETFIEGEALQQVEKVAPIVSDDGAL